MKYNIEFQIRCGKTTCASKPGKFCAMLNVNMSGSGTCHLFGKVFDRGGWLVRHPGCLKKARLDASHVRRIKK
jgi:hypothetical protein